MHAWAALVLTMPTMLEGCVRTTALACPRPADRAAPARRAQRRSPT